MAKNNSRSQDTEQYANKGSEKIEVLWFWIPAILYYPVKAGIMSNGGIWEIIKSFFGF